MTELLIPKHGGYRKLKSFQVAEVIYDLTVRFCDKYCPEHGKDAISADEYRLAAINMVASSQPRNQRH